MDIVLIPAYEPEEQLIPLARELKEAGFQVLVVDDGSGPKFKEVFDQVREVGHVLTHTRNMGKGAALKTGLVHIMKTPGVAVVTASGVFHQ